MLPAYLSGNRLRVLFAVYLSVCTVGGNVRALDSAISPDTTLPQPTDGFWSGSDYHVVGGTSAGANLFHSFTEFTVGTGHSAIFDGAVSIDNVIARVTGGTSSFIDGTLGSSIDGANLYLVNPAGIIFMANAALNVSGSFYASTADAIHFAGTDGTFYVDPTSNSALSVAPISAFGFLDASPGALIVESTNLVSGPGATLSLVGGDVTIGASDGSAPGYVFAPGSAPGNGNVRIASVRSEGQAVLGPAAQTDVSNFAALGTVRIQGNSLIDAANISIKGGDIHITDATVAPGTLSRFLLAPPPDGGEVELAATTSLEIYGTGFDPIFNAPYGVLVFAGLDPTVPFASMPEIKLSAPFMSLSGVSGVTVNRFGAGPSGTVAIDAGALTIANGASVSIVNKFMGDGGLIRIVAHDILLDGSGSEGFTGLAAQSAFNPNYPGVAFDPELTFAGGGKIDVTTSGTLALRGGAEISTDSRSFGPSGAIKLAVGELTVDASKIAAQSSLVGDAGAIDIAADGRVLLTNGGQISAATFGGGAGGAIRVSAGAGIQIEGIRSGVSSQTTPLPLPELNRFAEAFFGTGVTFAEMVEFFGLPPGSDLFSVLDATNAALFPPILIPLTAVPSERLRPGTGGAIELITPALSITGINAAIDSSTGWDGNAGDVHISADSITVRDGAVIGSRTGIPDLVNGQLLVGSGDAGSVNLSASGEIEISGAGASVSTDTRGPGDGGNVNINAFRLRIANHGEISSSSAGSGLAGNIDITLGDSLVLAGGSIATEASTSDGGNISIRAPRLVDLLNGQITTSVGSGQGNGGNIFIDPEFVVLQSSQIIANAFGGAGGNIDIIAGFLLVSPDSLIDASSALGVDGIVRTTAPDTDVSASLAVLPASYLDAASQLPAQCGAARAGLSSLTQVGRGGVPRAPSDYLLSAYQSSSSVAALDASTPTLALGCVE